MKQAAETEISRRIVVAGGINIDIGAVSFAPVRLGDSNPGRSHVSMGGVGRNIAHNLCLLGEKVTMLTAIGDDDYVPRIEAHCRKTGIDISRARRVSGAATSTWYLSSISSTLMAGAVALALGMFTALMKSLNTSGNHEFLYIIIVSPFLLWVIVVCS